MARKKIGRWDFRDLMAHNEGGEVYRIVGFITQPAVVFKNAKGETETHVVGSLNEKKLIRYAFEESAT